MAHNIVGYNSATSEFNQLSNTDVDTLANYVLEYMAAGTYAGTMTVAQAPSFVGQIQYDTTGYTGAGTAVPVQWPTGTQVGDYALIICWNCSIGGPVQTPTPNIYLGGQGSWQSDTTNAYVSAWFDGGVTASALSSMTITPDPSYSGNTYCIFQVYVFRGCNNIVITPNATGIGGTEIEGFTCPTKSTNSAFIITAIADRTGTNQWYPDPAWVSSREMKQLDTGVDATGGTFYATAGYLRSENVSDGEVIQWYRSRVAASYQYASMTIEVVGLATSNSIGRFRDTARYGAVGTTDAYILEKNYSLSQVSSATLSAQPNPPMYFGITTSGNDVIVQENLTTIEQLADEILNRLAAGGPNAYYLGPTAPSDGGIWSSVGSLTDTEEGFSVTNTTYYLWHKLNSGSYTTSYKSPLKLSSGEIIKFTDDEVKLFAKLVEERMISTSIGTYALQSSTPATGTWTNAGSATDLIRTTTPVDNQQYTSVVGFLGPSYYVLSYASFFTGPVQYLGISGYTGPMYYIGAAVIVYGPTGYLGPAANAAYVGSIAYTGNSFSGYLGPTAKVSGTFYGPGTTYSGPTTFYGPGPFTRTTFTGTASFTGPASFAGATTTNYASTFLDYIPTSAYFTGITNYVGPTTDAISSIDSSTTTASSVTLWRRIA